MEYIIKDNVAVLRLDKGDEIFSCVKKFAEENGIVCGTVSGIGATDRLEVGVFDLKSGKYVNYTYTDNKEILSLCGNITSFNGTYVHLHIVCQGNDGPAVGGHLFKATVSLTAEIFITIVNREVKRAYNEEVGINTLIFD